MTRATVTPLQALKRLIAVAKTADAMGFEELGGWNKFQGELGVAEMVVRDFPAKDILIANKLRDAAADPMWDGHAEVSKRLLVLAAENMEVARARIVELEGHATAKPAVPTSLEGYTLVPNSPNEEMLRPDGFSYRLGYDQYQAMLRAAPAAAQPALPKLPSTPEEVRDFIGINFDHLEDIGPVEDHRYTLTVHDLLSAFQDYGDAQPADPDDMAAGYDHSTHDGRMELLRSMRDEQPAVVAAPDWEDRLYVAMDAELALRESDERDEDGQRMGMKENDTQIGVEFAMKWFKQNMLATPAIAAPVEVERDAGFDALKALVDNLADGDAEGLIEHSEPMIAARKALAGYNPVAQCTNSDSWNCKYCHILNCEALKDPRNFGKPIAAIDAAIATGDKHE